MEAPLLLKRCEMTLSLTLYFVDFEHICTFSGVSIVEFEQVNVSWVGPWQISMIKLFAKVVNELKTLTIFTNTLHICLLSL